MIPEEYNGITYGMLAIWPENSTEANPVVQISSNEKGQHHYYNIDINSIDPNNATELEIFALCSYMDKIGRGTGSTFGSYNTLSTLRTYGNMVGENVLEEKSTWSDFQNNKKNWVELATKMMNFLSDINCIENYDLMKKGKKLVSYFESIS